MTSVLGQTTKLFSLLCFIFILSACDFSGGGGNNKLVPPNPGVDCATNPDDPSCPPTPGEECPGDLQRIDGVCACPGEFDIQDGNTCTACNPPNVIEDGVCKTPGGGPSCEGDLVDVDGVCACPGEFDIKDGTTCTACNPPNTIEGLNCVAPPVACLYDGSDLSNCIENCLHEPGAASCADVDCSATPELDRCTSIPAFCANNPLDASCPEDCETHPEDARCPAQIVFTPEPGTYNEAIKVTLGFDRDVPVGTDVVFSSNGEDPVIADCEVYTGWDIDVDGNVELKARYTNSQGDSKVFTAKYIINTGSGGDAGVNADILDDWLAFDKAVADWFLCELNSDTSECAQPGIDNVLGCSGRKCLPWKIRQFDENGVETGYLGLAPGAIDIAGGTAETIITYHNFRFTSDAALMATLVDENDPNNNSGSPDDSSKDGHENIQHPDKIPEAILGEGRDYDVTVSAVLVGKFSLDATVGEQSTSPDKGGAAIEINGDYQAVLNEETKLVNQEKTEGTFEVSCSEEGCASEPIIFLAPDWRPLNAPQSSGDSPSNRLALESWLSLEGTLAPWLSCELNSDVTECAQPGIDNVLGCSGRKCLPWIVNQYDAEGNVTGYVKLAPGDIDIGSGTAETIITYENFRWSSDSALMRALMDENDPNNNSGSDAPSNQAGHENIQHPDSLPTEILGEGVPYDITVSATLVGAFSFDGKTGSQSSAEDVGGRPITFAGTFNETEFSSVTIEDSTSLMLDQVRAEGTLTVSCVADGCSDKPQVFTAPDWPLLDFGAKVADTCNIPTQYLLQTKSGFCAQRMYNTPEDSSGTITLYTCDKTNPDQMWLVTPSGGVWTDPFDESKTHQLYALSDPDSVSCLVRIPGLLEPSFGWEKCVIGGSTSQRFFFPTTVSPTTLWFRDADKAQCLYNPQNYKIKAAPSCTYFDNQQFFLLEDGVSPVTPAQLAP